VSSWCKVRGRNPIRRTSEVQFDTVRFRAQRTRSEPMEFTRRCATVFLVLIDRIHGLRGLARIVPAQRILRNFLPIGTNWLGPGGICFTIRFVRGALMNFTGIVERDDWQIESWRSRAQLTSWRTIFVAGTGMCRC